MNTSERRNIAFSPPDITDDEIAEVAAALRSGWITTGPRTKLLENNIADYIGVRKAACLNSATAAMELSLRIMGVGEGDEVITSAYTYSASAAVIDHVGAKIVLADTAGGSYEMDYVKLPSLINQRTKAIIPVDIAGRMCDYDAIAEIVNQTQRLFQPRGRMQQAIGRIAVLADAAHAFGAEKEGRKCGTVADLTTFSFHAVKNLTTAEGGAVTWRQDLGLDDDWIYRQFMLLSLHGQSKDALSKSQIGSWEYDIESLAYKSNMTDILAALGLVQLRRYNQLLSRRKEMVRLYQEQLAPHGIEVFRHDDAASSSSGHLMMVRMPGLDEASRNRVIEDMAQAGVACNVHYKPLPMFSAYQKMGFSISNYPNAYNMYKNEITLPLHTLLQDEDILYICEQLVKTSRACARAASDL